eukprot:jgi/Bigna1/84108/fgenesh1_pg.123_\
MIMKCADSHASSPHQRDHQDWMKNECPRAFADSPNPKSLFAPLGGLSSQANSLEIQTKERRRMEMDTPLNPSKQTKYSSLDSYNDAHSHGHHSHGHGHGHGHGEGGDKINPDTKEGSTSHHSNHHGVVDVSLQKTRDREKRVLMTACSLCIIFMIAEIVGGLISGSLAILTDAVGYCLY